MVEGAGYVVTVTMLLLCNMSDCATVAKTLVDLDTVDIYCAFLD